MELLLPGGGELNPTCTTVVAPARFNPTFPQHDFQSSGQGGAVNPQDFAEAALRDFPRDRKRLQDGELGGPQSRGPQCGFIDLAQGPRTLAETAAQTRKLDWNLPFHTTIDVYTSIVDARKIVDIRRLREALHLDGGRNSPLRPTIAFHGRFRALNPKTFFLTEY